MSVQEARFSHVEARRAAAPVGDEPFTVSFKLRTPARAMVLGESLPLGVVRVPTHLRRATLRLAALLVSDVAYEGAGAFNIDFIDDAGSAITLIDGGSLTNTPLSDAMVETGLTIFLENADTGAKLRTGDSLLVLTVVSSNPGSAWRAAELTFQFVVEPVPHPRE